MPRSDVTSLLKNYWYLPTPLTNRKMAKAFQPFTIWNHLSNTFPWGILVLFCKPQSTFTYSTFAPTVYNALLLPDNVFFILCRTAERLSSFIGPDWGLTPLVGQQILKTYYVSVTVLSPILLNAHNLFPLSTPHESAMALICTLYNSLFCYNESLALYFLCPAQSLAH